MKNKLTFLSGIAVTVFFLVGCLILAGCPKDFNGYNITIITVKGGKLTSSHSKAQEGEKIELKAVPEIFGGMYYVFEDLKITGANPVVIGALNSRYFDMPAADITITPEFKLYTPNIFIKGVSDGFEEGGPGQDLKAYGKGYFYEAAGEGATATAIFDATTPVATGTPGNQSGRLDFNLGSTPGAAARMGRNNFPDLPFDSKS